MRRMPAVLAALAALAAAVPAAAQSGGSILVVSFGFGNPRTVKSWDLPVRFEGSVTVRFESAFGRGETVWTPGTAGQFTAAEIQTRKGKRMAAFLASTSDSAAVARVESRSGTCTDTGTEVFDQAAVIPGRTGVRIGLAGASQALGGFHMSETDCGGPLLDDIGRALGMVTVPRSDLVKGSFDVDLRGSAPVNTAGIRGTVVSTVVAHVGARTPPPRQPPDEATPGGTRLLTVDYSLERVSGSLGATFAGGGPLCAELASCGRSVTVGLHPGAPRDATIQFSASASGRRPLRDLRAALGLPNNGGSAKGIRWNGYARWVSRGNVLSAQLADQTGELCRDQRHVPALALQLRQSGSAVLAQLEPDFVSVPRTSCPGPSLSAGTYPSVLASGLVARGAIGRRRITLHLTRGHSLTTDGWSGRTTADVTLVLKRGAIHSRRFSN